MTSSSATTMMTLPDLHHSQSPKIITVNITTLVFAILFVSLRLASRHLSSAPFGWDDILILLALFLTFGSSAFNIVAAAHGAGRHQALVSERDRAILAQIIYGIEMLYPPLVTAIKCSILTLYLRLFGVRPLFRKTIYIMLALVVGWCIAVFFAAVFQASPPRLLWTTNLKELPEGWHHINFPAYLVGHSVPNVVMDFAILGLPVGIVWQLQISRSRKLGLSAVFAVGAFVCAVSIIRAYAVANVSFTDRTYAYASTFIWSTVEVNIGIICACLPVLHPVVAKALLIIRGGRFSAHHRVAAKNDEKGEEDSHRVPLKSESNVHVTMTMPRGEEEYVKEEEEERNGSSANMNMNKNMIHISNGTADFRKLVDEDVVQVQTNPPSSTAWAEAERSECGRGREVRMNAIRVRKDVDLEDGRF